MSKYSGLLVREIEARLEEIDALLSEEGGTANIRALNLEKGRLLKELRSREQTKNISIPDPAQIPHVFFNVELTAPANKDLADYLSLCLEHYPESLRYIFNKSQEYVDYGGCRKMTFAQWKAKLTKDLRNCKW